MIGKNRTRADDPATSLQEREDRARASAAESASEAVQTASAAVGDAAAEAADAADPTSGGGSPDLGVPGRPLNRHHPVYLGFFGGLGVMVAIGLVSLVSQLSSVLTLLVISLFLALGLDPIVQLLVARGLRRGQAVAVTFLAVILLFVGIIALLVPPVVGEAVDLADNLPDYVARLQTNRQLNDLDNQYHFFDEIQNQLHQKDFWTGLFGGVLGAGKAVVSGLFSSFTVLVLTLYLTASLPGVKKSVYKMVPRSRRQRVTFLSEEISRRVGGYFLGQIGVATLNAVCSYVMMKIIGVPVSAGLAVEGGPLRPHPPVRATP